MIKNSFPAKIIPSPVKPEIEESIFDYEIPDVVYPDIPQIPDRPFYEELILWDFGKCIDETPLLVKNEETPLDCERACKKHLTCDAFR